MLQEIRKLLHAAIQGTEFERYTYFAGGCVRDELIGRKTSDLDITVELPDGGIRLAEFLHKQGLCSTPVIYKQFGTALIFWKDYKIELVMTRRESYRSRSRKPEVVCGTLLEDVLRRDFTVNSLLMRVADGAILDLSGKGINDIEAKLIRATSDPDILFKEDPLRLLRAVRFASSLDFSIEKITLSVLAKMAPMLKHISKERKAEEFLKIMSSPQFLSGLQLLNKTGIIKEILPKLIIPSQLVNGQIENVTDFPGILVLSLLGRCALLLWRHEDPTPLLDMLKLSQKDIGKVCRLIDCCKSIRHLQAENPVLSTVQIRKKAFWYRDILDEIVVLFPLTGMFQKTNDLNLKNDEELCNKLKQEAVLLDANRFSLTGDDLMRTFCSENGSWVGEMLLRGREYWFAHPDADKKELLEYLTELYQK